MIILCVIELIPLLSFLIMCLFLFTIFNIQLHMIPAESSLLAGSNQGLGFTETMFIYSFLTCLGNLQRIRYDPSNMIYYSSGAKFLNVYMTNIMWIIECFVLLVLIVNFLICVIFNTYEEVKPI